ncbi:hypothetical protein GGS26DRAFT_590501 [Hypomontagnella submonticulosa]|nr:hypothetical protein GGS26DRAFT_590501 [Hypomontagnella submonticulosa]
MPDAEDVRVPTYRYEPLLSQHAVRLVILHLAETESNPLGCSIIQLKRYSELVKPGNRQGCSAVSYAWGEPNFSESLMIKESNSNSITYLPISQNVSTMLCYFRKPRKPVYLWIDAVCLDQQK